jgi:hypothetical protein
MKTRNGFASFEILAVLAVVTLVGFLGYTAYMRYQGQVATKKSTDVVATAPAKIDDITVDKAPLINETADLPKADATLDSINIDSVEDDEDLGKFEKAMN